MLKGRIRVVIAEDDLVICDAVSQMLVSNGYNIVGVVSNGRDAVRMTCDLKPDVVIMDIRMDKLDGLKAAAQIQKKCPTPVVVLTSFENEELVKKATRSGVGAYLKKPPKVSDLIRSIEVSIARHSDMIKVKSLNEKLRKKNLLLKKALSEVRILKGILPICSNCKKIRNDKGYWERVESFIEKNSDAYFTHSLCETCSDQLYGNENWYSKVKKAKTNPTV